MEWLPYFIAAHGIGDFWLQNDWMAANKTRSHVACFSHVSAYMLPFLALVIFMGAPAMCLVLIAVQHYAQDRYSLHVKWMSFYGQTPPSKWPVGPLCLDQTGHIAWLALVSIIFR